MIFVFCLHFGCVLSQFWLSHVFPLYSRREGPAYLLFRIWSQWFTTSQSTSNTWKLRSNSARYIHRQIFVCVSHVLISLLLFCEFRYFSFCLCAWLQEELQGMKQRIRVVVVENEKLQSGLKSKAVDESLKDYTIQNATVMCVFFKNRVNDVCACDII